MGVGAARHLLPFVGEVLEGEVEPAVREGRAYSRARHAQRRLARKRAAIRAALALGLGLGPAAGVAAGAAALGAPRCRCGGLGHVAGVEDHLRELGDLTDELGEGDHVALAQVTLLLPE